MIRVRYASLDTTKEDVKIEINQDEYLNDAVKRALEGVPLETKIEDTFQAVVNGYHIHSDLWSATKLKTSDMVIVSPVLHGGDDQTFKQFAILAISIAASSIITPAGGATLLSSLAVAGVTMAGALLLNALIPPPTPDAGLFEVDGQSGSQMYSITGQSNALRKFQTVPKVYGTHRMFPVIAANPYTELETDPETGNLSQYLYAIYDFGLGPVQVGDIYIGDSPITNFSDIVYNIVDLHKPTVSEGTWDDQTIADFQFYKTDVESDSAAVALNGNRNLGSPLDTYEVIRNTALNADNTPQEITLSFVNPSGLYAFDATGRIFERGIYLEIFYSKVGEDDWKPYNDENEVNSFGVVGGSELFTDAPFELLQPADYGPPDYEPQSVYQKVAPDNLFPTYLSPYFSTASTWVVPSPNPNNAYNRAPMYYTASYWGLPKGATSFVAKPISGAVIGDAVTLGYGAPVVATITSISAYIPDPTYNVYGITPLGKSITMFNTLRGTADTIDSQYQDNTKYVNLGTLNMSSFIYLKKKVIGQALIYRASVGSVYSTVKFSPKEAGQFKVRVTRVSTTSITSTQFGDALTLVGVSTRFGRRPILSNKRHTYLEIKIRATNQLNGSIQNLSAVCSSVLPVWNGSAWVKQITNNPAWIFADLLTGEVNKRAISQSRLHLPSLVEWAEFCDEVPDAPTGKLDYIFPRFQANFILDFQTTLQQLLQQLCGSAQASLNLIDGKYGVLLDVQRTVPVQIFTPRNSRDFSSTRSYTQKPHAITVKYVDPATNWQVTELVVYDDGYDEETATVLDDIATFAVTNNEQAWRWARYMMAQNKLRQENMTLTVDFEHLVCSRGDYVQITQDSMKVGGTPARVVSLSGNEVTIDDGIDTDPMLDYGYVFRNSEGEIYTDTLTVIDSDTFELDGDLPEKGDLIIIGEVGKIVFDCIVKSITPNDDMSATLTLVEKADAIYDAESSDVFPPYDPQVSQTVNPDFAPPSEVIGLVVADNTYECFGSGYRYYVDLDWDAPQGAAYEAFEVYANSGSGYNLVITTRNSYYRYIVDETLLGAEHEFKVLAVSATGKKLDLGAVGSVTATPISKSTPPSNVEALNIDITGEVLQLFWPQIEDCDVREYLIRYSPLTTPGIAWESSIPLLRIDRNGTLAATQARTGTYLIKAVDYNGNESADAALAITTVPNLFGLNVIEEISDFPDLEGSFDRTVDEGGVVSLDLEVIGGPTTQEYYEEGFYYYKDLLDLGEIYSVRLQSQIQAEGFTAEDLMSNWPTLDSVLALANSNYSEWDVETQYRSTESFNVISDWAALTDIAAMNEGAEDNWTEWRKFIMGDATGRIFQFRLRLMSFKPSVTPRVFDGTIKADMPDRFESYENLLVDAVTGYELEYDPPFKGPGTSPNIQVSIEDAQSGDYAVYEDKTLDGVTIKIYDNTDTQVERLIDVAVKGYGRKYTSAI